jgi:hypothetical protein
MNANSVQVVDEDNYRLIYFMEGMYEGHSNPIDTVNSFDQIENVLVGLGFERDPKAETEHGVTHSRLYKKGE